MKWIGLTGGIGSGKSSVSKLLRDTGYEVIDADVVAQSCLEKGTPTYNQVIEEFGKSLLSENETIDRIKLASLVFGNRDQLEKLEAIIHPAVQAEVIRKRKQLERSHVKAAFYDVPLLFEKKLTDQFDFVVVVYCSEDQQIERVMQRNKFSKEQVLERIHNQMPLAEKKNLADYTIDNSKGLADLDNSVAEFLGAAGLKSPKSTLN